jgi:DNA-binding SARP family transcriptional activator
VIQLNTLGDAFIRVGNREVRPTSPAVFAALLYLGVERGKRVPRAALQELLFPETDERSGAHSLRQLLYKLRQLGATVQTEGDVVWLAAEDVSDDYSAPVHTNGNGNGSGNGNGNGHSRGGFLASYMPKVSAAFDEWLESRRATIGVKQRRDLIKQMLARRDAADWPSVERIAQEVLASDPFNEEATLALAESTALSGSKSEAIRILERYESETGRADLKLPASVLRKRISERLPDRRRRPLDTPFVGRDAEAEIMRQAVVRLRAGEGGSIVISGEPGIGKTRLIEETTALALLEGVTVHVVRCQPHYANRPMGVFIEWVPQLLQSRGALGVSPETMEYLTLLTSHKQDRAQPTDARDDATRAGVLLAAVRDVVDAVAAENPVFLVVEDAHWSDANSLGELLSLLEKRRNARFLVALVSRPSESVRKALGGRDSAAHIHLRPLTDSSMLALSKHLVVERGAEAESEAVRSWCATTSGGNPFFLQMLCGHYEETGQRFSVPPSIRNATIGRIERLPGDARQLLELVVLLGRNATIASAQALLNRSGRAFVDAVRALELHGFLRQVGHQIRAAHDLVSECVLGLTPPLTLLALHGQVAATLELTYEESRDANILWDCATHWAAAGNHRSATTFARKCAEHATGIGRAQQALELLKASLTFAISPSDRREVLAQMAITARAAGLWADALDSIERLRNSSSQRALDLEWDLEYCELEARWSLTLETTGVVDRLTRHAGSDQNPSRERIQAALLVVRIGHEIADATIAARAYDSVVSLLNPRDIDLDSRMLMLVYATSFGPRDGALAVSSQLLSDLDQFEVNARLRLARNMVVAMCIQANPERAASIAVKYFDIARALDLELWQFSLAASCSSAFLEARDPQNSSIWYDRAEAIRSPSKTTFLDIGFLTLGVELAISLNDRQCAARRLEELSRLPFQSAPRFVSALTASAARVRLMEPDFVPDDSLISKLSGTAAIGEQSDWGESIAIALATALARRGDLARARDVAQKRIRSRPHDRVPPELASLIDSRTDPT